MKSIIWQCKECGEKKVSHSRQHPCIDVCKCDNSFMDLEKEYCRTSTNIKIIKEFDDEEYPFGLELFYCLLNQFPEQVVCKKYNTLENFHFMINLRDKLYLETYK
jgi:hypothetical protein